MAHRYVNLTGKEINAGALSFRACAENEIESMFDAMENCALTTVSVIVSDDSGEAIAELEYNPGFYFSEGYNAAGDCWSADVFRFDFGADDGAAAMAAHGWDYDETTPDDVAALESAAGGAQKFWDAAEAAAADVCRRLETDVRALRYEDTSECVDFPAYALPLLFNGDMSGMDAEDIKNFEEWHRRITCDFEPTDFAEVNPGADPYFSSSPAFGLPADCVRIAVIPVEPESRRS